MAAKQSAEMKKALKLIEQGRTPTEAAKLSGVLRTSIYNAIKREKEKKVLANVL